jgi:tRNA U34 5-methylaminomethyl-2-thiouridine-forming methyltransferase MnmC
MKRVRTDDGSVTFYNSKFGEAYHSTSGAVEEAFEKFVRPSKIADFVKKKKTIKLLDICFGLGYNSAAFIDEVLNHNADCKIFITALENDEEILKEALRLNTTFASFDMIQRLIKSQKRDLCKLDLARVKIKLYVKDALRSIKAISNKFDFVFLDPFSPKKCPELWTEEFFKDIYKLMNKKGVLTTYSCARSVRDNLKAAGFKVEDGPSVGRRSPSTIAYR